MKIDKSKIKKILLIKLKGIGDVVLSTVAIDNLRREFPAAKIDFLTEPPSRAALECLSELNEIIVFEKNDPLGGLKLLWKIRSRSYDLIFDFYSNPRTAMLTFFSGARYRAGFPYRGREYAYNLKGPSVRDKFHAAELHLEFLRTLGLESSSDRLYFGLAEEDTEFAKRFFSEKFPDVPMVIGLSPSGGWPSKKCDPVKFAEIGDALMSKYPDAGMLILWGPGDQAEALEIHKKMKHKALLAPLTDIRKMAALISQCSLLVANDSGPMHISTAVGTPTLSLHGPTDPMLQGPFGKKHEWIRLDELECIGCNLLECNRNHECFRDLPVSRIMEKTEFLIKKNGLLERINSSTQK